MDQEQQQPKRKPGTFRPGHSVHRPRGSRNRIPTSVKQALVRAGENIGLDGAGLNGLDGFFERIGRLNEVALGTMISRTLPLEVRQETTITTNLLLSAPAYVTMRLELMQALAPFPEARMAVAQVLHTIEADASDDEHDVAEHDETEVAA
jgi:hypothetical protein